MRTEIELTMREALRYGVHTMNCTRTVKGIEHGTCPIREEPIATGHVVIEGVKIPVETTCITEEGEIEPRAVFLVK